MVICNWALVGKRCSDPSCDPSWVVLSLEPSILKHTSTRYFGHTDREYIAIETEIHTRFAVCGPTDMRTILRARRRYIFPTATPAAERTFLSLHSMYVRVPRMRIILHIYSPAITRPLACSQRNLKTAGMHSLLFLKIFNSGPSFFTLYTCLGFHQSSFPQGQLVLTWGFPPNQSST